MQALFSAVPDPPQISEVPKRRRGRPRGAPNRKRETITAKQYERLTIPMQIKQAFAPGARVAGLTGLLVGGLVPIATWGVVHFEVQENVWLWFLALRRVGLRALPNAPQPCARQPKLMLSRTLYCGSRIKWTSVPSKRS